MKAEKNIRVAACFFVLAALCIRGFYEAALSYDDYRISYGLGVIAIHKDELVFYLWYLIYGAAGTASLAAGLAFTGFPARLESWLRRVFERPLPFLLAASSLLLGACLVFRKFVLLDSPIADDESTYVFIAQTLLQGRVVNPLPGDNAFFQNQFVMLNQAGWFGKYPIGHPLFLALGQAVGLGFLPTPLLTCATLGLTYVVGRRLFGRMEACLAICLLLVSPHFVCTGATQLSQPASTFCMMLGLLAMLRVTERQSLGWSLLAGGAWGLGVLVRPLPGGLFLLAAALVFVFGGGQNAWVQAWRTEWRMKLKCLFAAAIPVLLVTAVFLWVNRQQTGDALASGYHTAHRSLGILDNNRGQISLSVAGGVLRENFWLFGWPFSFAFVWFARGRGSLALFWSLIAAEYAYRVLVPKTVVATTGPIYLTESVPLLALATASGMVGASRWLRKRGQQGGKAWVVSAALSATLIASVTFLPVQLTGIHRSSKAWQSPYRMLRELGAGRALVFGTYMVPPQSGLSWAYHPPNPSPRLDGPVIFVRLAKGRDSKERMLEFWRRRFPDRSAWMLGHEGDKAVLASLAGSESRPP